jgi:hypothetical protein
MTATAKEILKKMMALDEGDRAELADRITESLEQRADPDYVVAWETDIKRKLADIDSGRAKMIPAAR